MFRFRYGVVWTSIFLLLFCSTAFAQSPRFQRDGDMDGARIAEDVVPGTTVFVLRGDNRSGPDSELRYSIQPDDVFEVRNSRSGDVTLVRELDFEVLQEYVVEAILESSGGTTTSTATVTVTDVNDNKPVFSFSTSQPEVEISERSPRSTQVLEFSVTDRDQVGDDLYVECLNDFDAEYNPCDYFQVYSLLESTSEWGGELVTRRALDAEQTQRFEVTLQVTDAEFNVQSSVTVLVTDYPDSPPEFLPPLTSVVEEDAPVGTTVMRVEAVDTDLGNQREIKYELDTNSPYFTLDLDTGELVVASPLNAPGDDNAGQTLEIQVTAREVLEDGSLGRDITTTKDQVIRISVQDVNDHPPQFDAEFYSTNMTEDIRELATLHHLTLTVTDVDQGSNAVYEVELLTHDDIFAIYPSQGRGTTSFNIRIIDTSTIDYDLGVQLYTIQVRVNEIQSSERFFSDATAFVSVLDINDNTPIFEQPRYNADIREGAQPGASILTVRATDLDSGYYGQDGIRYALQGNNAQVFKINTRTGRITLREGQQLDYEGQNKEYVLTVLARDNLAEGHIGTAELTINVLNDNDNPPVFIPTHGYDTFIDEGDTDPSPRLQVEATDLDGDDDPIRYRIIAGNDVGLWRIDDISGHVEATEPIYNDMTGGTGIFRMTVEASDGENTATIGITVTVLLGYNNAPDFTQDGQYQVSIVENTAPGTVVETVRADDPDPSDRDEGRVQYSITRGSQGKFIINQDTGVITVSSGSTFDYDVQREYEMRVIARDGGDPVNTGTATVIVLIIDANSNAPIFVPTTQRATVNEDEHIGFQVIRMIATDADADAVLRYRFVPGTQIAYDGQGASVSLSDFDFTDLFAIHERTAWVTVNQPLDHDTVRSFRTEVEVEDISAPPGGPPQIGTGILIITVQNVNQEPPKFVFPWTEENPNIFHSVREEQPIGTFVRTILATDDDSSRITFEIIDNTEGYFAIDPNTGAITIARVIDYERPMESTTFVVTATDSGDPRLTSTATVSVTVININDNNPIFTRPVVNINVVENDPGNRVVGRLEADDADFGTFGDITYGLNDPDGRFTIDSETGEISVVPGATLDREAEPNVISIIGTACDSPDAIDSSVQRCSSIPVDIRLQDENDNVPTLGDDDVTTTIIQAIPPGTAVIRVVGDDPDLGDNSTIIYDIDGPPGIFEIDPETGDVTITEPIPDDAPEQYNVTILLCDRGTPSQCGRDNLIITIQQAGNNPPRWVFPGDNGQIVDLIEENYVGQEVTEVRGTDSDSGTDGQIDYGFVDDAGNVVQQQNGFLINSIRGIITAQRVFDRDSDDDTVYELNLIIRDRGSPRLASRRRIRIRITDINDNLPEFPPEEQPPSDNCCPRDFVFHIGSNSRVNTEAGQVEAFDKDEGSNAIISYTMLPNDGPFSIDRDTGRIYTTRLLTSSDLSYVIQIQAGNEIDPFGLSGNDCICDQSTVDVIINIDSSGAQLFDKDRYDVCISMNTSIGSTVTSLGDNVRNFSPGSFVFRFTSIVTFLPVGGNRRTADLSTLLIDSRDGDVTTNSSMEPYHKHYFNTTVEAADANGTQRVGLRVFVTDPAYAIRLNVSAPRPTVIQDLDEIIEAISNQTNSTIVCVSQIIAGIGGTTEIVFHVFDGQTLIAIGDAPVILGRFSGDFAAAGMSIERWDDFITDPVLGCVIALLALLLLALILLCCLCFCLDRFKKRRGDAYAANLIMVDGGKKHGGFDEQEMNMNLYPEGGYNQGVITVQGSIDRGLMAAQQDQQMFASGAYAEQQMLAGVTSGEESDFTIVAPLEGHSQSGLRIEAPLQGSEHPPAYGMLDSPSISFVQGSGVGTPVPISPLNASPTRMGHGAMGAVLQVQDDTDYDMIHGPSYEPAFPVGMNQAHSMHNVHTVPSSPMGVPQGAVVMQPGTLGQPQQVASIRAYASAGDLYGGNGPITLDQNQQSSSYVETRQFHSYSEYPN